MSNKKKLIKCIFNGLILGFVGLVSTLIALGRFPTSFELYNCSLIMLSVIGIELINAFGLKNNKKTQYKSFFLQ